MEALESVLPENDGPTARVRTVSVNIIPRR